MSLSGQRVQDEAASLYAVLGVIYAVLIALVVIAVWEDYAVARDTGAIGETFGSHYPGLLCSVVLGSRKDGRDRCVT